MTTEDYFSSPYRREADRLYREAFPPDERFPYRALKRRASDGRGRYLIAREEGEFSGLAYLVEGDDLVYLFFLAVPKDLRGRGTGSAILGELRRMYPGRRILAAAEEAEPSYGDYELRLRRRQFYERAGFSPAGVKIKEGRVRYDLLCSGGNVSYAEYEKMIFSFMGRLYFLRYYGHRRGRCWAVN